MLKILLLSLSEARKHAKRLSEKPLLLKISDRGFTKLKEL
jgi:hypothetical protein